MGNTIEISGRVLTRNWVLNLVGQMLPLPVALITIPYVIRGLGTERFGLLSIAWVLLGYIGLFDLGLGRATTKFVAECLGRDEVQKLPGLVWTSVGCQLFFGLAGAVLAGVATPLVVNRFLRISPALVGEAKLSFVLLAAFLPIVLAGNGFRGTLEAAQRFDIVNYVKVPASIAIFLLPALAIPLGLRLPGVVCLLGLSRLASGLAYLVCCLRLFPALRNKVAFDSELFRTLFSYGGWVTVSNIVGPFLTYMDRFFIGSVLSVTAVGYYTAPYEAISRVWLFPGSLVATLFPAFTSLDAGGSKQRVEDLCARSLKSLLLILGPSLLLVVAFAHEALRLWLGADFAANSTLVLQILAVGMLIQCLGIVPFTVIQGLGRPDLTAKLHLLELPFYAVSLWLLLKHMGLPGAALAWTLRLLLDSILLFGVAIWHKFMSFRDPESRLGRATFVLVAFGLALFLPLRVGASLLTQGLLATFLVPVFAAVAWSHVLDSKDRSLVAFVAGLARTGLMRAR